MREVIPGLLWIGNAADARDVVSVLKQGITAVVDLAIEESPILYPRDTVYCRFPLLDSGGNSPSLLQMAILTTAIFIDAKTPTLVTCSGGMSRSPAIVAAALAQVEAITLHDALERIATAGPHDVSPAFWETVTLAVEKI